MRRDGLVSVAAAAWLMATASALPARDAQHALARPPDDKPKRPLQGRFLHITGEIEMAGLCNEAADARDRIEDS